MQITPTDITNYNRTDAELQAFWLFGAFCAGKNSDYASKCLSRLLHKCENNPFDYLKSLGEVGVHNALVAAKIGQYGRLTKFVMQSLELDLRTATLDQLLNVHGIGSKTARFFLLHTRPNLDYAVLDTHILKYVAEKGHDVPKQTPTNKSLYAKIEKTFIYHARIDFPYMSIADIDLMLWGKYSGRLEVETKSEVVELFWLKNLDNFPQFATFLPHPITIMTNEDLTQIEETLDNCANELLDAINASEELRGQYKQFSAHLNLAIHSASLPVKQKTKKEIILETAAFYGEDPSRRAVVQEDGRAKCRYFTQDGRKCAVGRCMIEGKKIAYARMEFPADKVDASVGDLEDLENQLLPEYRGHDVYFWNELQEFHDTDWHFVDTGLSLVGQQALTYLLETYAK